MAQSSSLEQYALSLLRIVAAFTFSLHGFQKLFGFFGGVGHGASAHLFSLLWVAAVIESAGGILMLLGLYTRPVAFILCGEMAVAYFKQHAPRGFWIRRTLRPGWLLHRGLVGPHRRRAFLRAFLAMGGAPVRDRRASLRAFGCELFLDD